MQQILRKAKCDPTAGRPFILSYNLTTRKTWTTSIQMVATPIDTNAPAQSVGWLQGSNDLKNWIDIAYLTTSGSGVQMDGGPYVSLWETTRFKLESTTNCVVDVFLSQRES